VNTRSFRVEHAGCSTCADRVRKALSRFGEVAEITVDEEADVADVALRIHTSVEEGDVNAALAEVSVGSGHSYRVAAGSWR
jgi:copper chaperone CopZ